MPVRSDDHTAAAPRSVSKTVARLVSWSGAVTSNTRSSRVPPSAVLDTQYATRLPVPDTAPVKPRPRNVLIGAASVSRRSSAGAALPASAMNPRESERSEPGAVAGTDGLVGAIAVGLGAGSPPSRVRLPAQPAYKTARHRIP